MNQLDTVISIALNYVLILMEHIYTTLIIFASVPIKHHQLAHTNTL